MILTSDLTTLPIEHVIARGVTVAQDGGVNLLAFGLQNTGQIAHVFNGCFGHIIGEQQHRVLPIGLVKCQIDNLIQCVIDKGCGDHGCHGKGEAQGRQKAAQRPPQQRA